MKIAVLSAERLLRLALQESLDKIGPDWIPMTRTVAPIIERIRAERLREVGLEYGDSKMLTSKPFSQRTILKAAHSLEGDGIIDLMAVSQSRGGMFYMVRKGQNWNAISKLPIRRMNRGNLPLYLSRGKDQYWSEWQRAARENPGRFALASCQQQKENQP